MKFQRLKYLFLYFCNNFLRLTQIFKNNTFLYYLLKYKRSRMESYFLMTRTSENLWKTKNSLMFRKQRKNVGQSKKIIWTQVNRNTYFIDTISINTFCVNFWNAFPYFHVIFFGWHKLLCHFLNNFLCAQLMFFNWLLLKYNTNISHVQRKKSSKK